MSKRKELIKEYTSIFHHWVKLKNANTMDMVRCFTCDKVCHISSIDAGHFLSSKCMSTKWDEQNVHPQCRECNGKENGMRSEYAKRLDECYGDGTAERLTRKSNMYKKYTESEMQSNIDYYKNLVYTYSS